MLSNGSNPEGVMPSPAFNWMDKNKSVIVHGPKMSPAVNKIRVYLQYAGIKYKLVTHLPSGIRSGPYTKVPNIDVNGRQMNDSYIILQHICSLIKLPIDLTWEREFVLHLDIGLKLQTSDKDWGKLANKCVGAPCCLQNLIGRKAIGPMERKQGMCEHLLLSMSFVRCLLFLSFFLFIPLFVVIFLFCFLFFIFFF